VAGSPDTHPQPPALAGQASPSGGARGAFGRDVAALAVFGGILAWIVLSGGRPGAWSAEAYHRAMVAGDLVQGLSRGRQGLVGSLALAPLPTVAVAFLSVVPQVGTGPGAGALLAALSALLLALYANRLWAEEGLSGWLRLPAIACVLLLPPVALSIGSGSSAMMFAMLAACGWGYLCAWLKARRLRDLAYAALLLGLSVGVRYQGALLVAGAALFAAGATLAGRRETGLLEAVAFVFLTPALYVAALWVGGNWLILGEPGFFLRGLSGAPGAWTLLTWGCEWGVVGTVALAVLAVPLAGLVLPDSPGARRVALLGGVLAAAWLALNVPAGAGARLPDVRIPSAVAALQREHPNGSFIVTGYQGYEFALAAGEDPERAWVHVMHLDPGLLGEILRDFRGRDLYVLVDTERRLERWEDVGLEWRGPRRRVPEGFIYAGSVGPWAVFECIRAEEPLLTGG